MKIDYTNPKFKQYVENTNESINGYIKSDNYFTLNDEKKLSLQLTTSKLIKKLIITEIRISNDEIKKFLFELSKKNEQIENFEMAELYKNMINNFDVIFDKPKVVTRKNKIYINDKNEDIQ